VSLVPSFIAPHAQHEMEVVENEKPDEIDHEKIPGEMVSD